MPTRPTPTRLIALSAAALLAGLACALFSPGATPGPPTPVIPDSDETPLPPTPLIPDTRPADFAVRYDWREGTLAPPYYYQYTIEVAPDGLTTLTFIPDYPADDVPVWTETLTLDAAQHDALYAALTAAGLFSTAWQAEGDPPVGGGSEWLTATAHGVSVDVPAYPVAGQRDTHAALAALMEAVIPPATWEAIHAQRDQYVAEHEE